jgi:hypothetical protein
MENLTVIVKNLSIKPVDDFYALNGYLLDNLFFTNLSNPNFNSGDDLK